MSPPADRAQQPYRVATVVVTFLALSQGAVPLVARGLFDREQRFAAALRLPAPWWWVACLAVTATGLALLAAIDAARRRTTAADEPGRAPAGGPGGADGEDRADRGTTPAGEAADRAGAYDALAALVFLVGVYNGVAPFVSRLVLDGDLLLALPLRLPSPWWWVASLAVIAVTAVLLAILDRARDGVP